MAKTDELKKEIEKLKKIYAEELKRKDTLIDELKEQNTLIMKSALKQSEKMNDLAERLKATKIKKQKRTI